MRFYEALGLEPKLALDADDLKKRFYDRSRQWHPDRFSRASADEQQKALDMTALINDAYRTLSDPIARVEYFLKEKGQPLGGVPKNVLQESFEFNMLLDEYRSGDTSVLPELTGARDKSVKLRAEIDRLIGEFSALYDQGSEVALEGLRELPNVRRYYSNFLKQVEKELNVHAAN